MYNVAITAEHVLLSLAPQTILATCVSCRSWSAVPPFHFALILNLPTELVDSCSVLILDAFFWA